MVLEYGADGSPTWDEKCCTVPVEKEEGRKGGKNGGGVDQRNGIG